ncbi:MAG: sulfite exporter TauE/SafE family protein [Chthoniobacteraceae bacterium]
MSLFEILTLAAVAALAGAVNAVAGGGTLLTFPALIFFGTTPIVANATNTLALFIGAIGSVFSFRRQLDTVKPWLARFVPVSVLGGLVGSVLLTQTSERVFSQLVPFLLLFATVVFLAQGAFRRFVAPEHPHRRMVWAAIVFQFGVAVYGGYFGAGIGILMLASLGFLGLGDIHDVNALKNVLASLINFTAAVWFVASGLIDWPRAAVMTVGALGGYFLGAHYSQRLPQKTVRGVIIGVGLAISGYFFWRQFA